MKLHQKGFLLVEISKVVDIWENLLIDKVLIEYKLSGDYWKKSIRVALDELSSAGLILKIEQKLENTAGKPKLLFRYALSDFGRLRMLDTGLLT